MSLELEIIEESLEDSQSLSDIKLILEELLEIIEKEIIINEE